MCQWRTHTSRLAKLCDRIGQHGIANSLRLARTSRDGYRAADLAQTASKAVLQSATFMIHAAPFSKQLAELEKRAADCDEQAGLTMRWCWEMTEETEAAAE